MNAEHHIKQLPAIAADHRLHVTMDAAIRTAGNLSAVLALRTLKNVSPAHSDKIAGSGINIQAASAWPATNPVVQAA